MEFSDAAAEEAPGWYGKLAGLGDFADRRLPRAFVGHADAWLSQAMSASRAQLGTGWLETYLNAPLLRFAWAPGVFDAAWWFGVLMPSCDNVGRYFPLLIAARRLEPPQTGADLDHLDAWFDHLAMAATETLVDGASVDAFEEALGTAPRWPAGPPPTTCQAAHVSVGAPTGSLRQWLHGTAVATLRARYAGCSIWWHPGDQRAARIVPGLPEPASFTAMLSMG